jgi:citrate synthase
MTATTVEPIYQLVTPKGRLNFTVVQEKNNRQVTIKPSDPRAWLEAGILIQDVQAKLTAIGPATAISDVYGEYGFATLYGEALESVTERLSYMEVVYKCLHGGREATPEEAKAFERNMIERSTIPNAVAKIIHDFPTNSDPQHMLQAAIAALGALPDAPKNVKDPEQRQSASRDLIAKMPTMIAMIKAHKEGRRWNPTRGDSFVGNYLQALMGDAYRNLPQEYKEAYQEAWNQYLTCHVAHGSNASAFASLVTTTTGADPYNVALAGISTLYGPAHGGAAGEVSNIVLELQDWLETRFVGETPTAEMVKVFLREKKENDPSFMAPGIGHAVYKGVRDGRAVILEAAFEHLVQNANLSPEQTKVFDIAKLYIETAEDVLNGKNIKRNVDSLAFLIQLVSGFTETDENGKTTAQSAYFPMNFGVARMVGYMALMNEAHENGYLIIRPEQTNIEMKDENGNRIGPYCRITESAVEAMNYASDHKIALEQAQTALAYANSGRL